MGAPYRYQNRATSPPETSLPETFVVTLSCPHRVGIVNAVTAFLVERGGNITEAAQFNDSSTGLFFMRVRFEAGATSLSALRESFAVLATGFEMTWGVFGAGERLPTLIMVSKLGHCLNDLLYRHRAKLSPLNIRDIVSNHRDYCQLAASYDTPFHYLPVTPEKKTQAEARLLKIIGATAHYVTANLDEGLIIEPNIVRADHGSDAAGLTDLGRDIESGVLACAVAWHTQRRVLVNGSKTIVFR